jgi:hypothetical protein
MTWTTNEVSGALIQGMDHAIPFDSQRCDRGGSFWGAALISGKCQMVYLDWI